MNMGYKNQKDEILIFVSKNQPSWLNVQWKTFLANMISPVL